MMVKRWIWLGLSLFMLLLTSCSAADPPTVTTFYDTRAFFTKNSVCGIKGKSGGEEFVWLAPLLVPLITTAGKAIFSFASSELTGLSAANSTTYSSVAPTYLYTYSPDNKNLRFMSERCLVFVRGRFSVEKNNKYPEKKFSRLWTSANLDYLRKTELKDLYGKPNIFLILRVVPSNFGRAFQVLPYYVQYNRAHGGDVFRRNHDLVVRASFQLPRTKSSLGTEQFSLTHVHLPFHEIWKYKEGYTENSGPVDPKSLGWIALPAPSTGADAVLAYLKAHPKAATKRSSESPLRDVLDPIGVEPLNVTVTVVETDSAPAYLKSLAKATSDALKTNGDTITAAVEKSVVPAQRQQAAANQATKELAAYTDEKTDYVSYHKAALSYRDASAGNRCSAYAALKFSATALIVAQRNLRYLGLNAEMPPPRTVPPTPAGC